MVATRRSVTRSPRTSPSHGRHVRISPYSAAAHCGGRSKTAKTGLKLALRATRPCSSSRSMVCRLTTVRDATAGIDFGRYGGYCCFEHANTRAVSACCIRMFKAAMPPQRRQRLPMTGIRVGSVLHFCPLSSLMKSAPRCVHARFFPVCCVECSYCRYYRRSSFLRRLDLHRIYRLDRRRCIVS